jgi:hypothetical protein
MNTALATVPDRSHRIALRTALFVDAVLWFATGAAARNRELYGDSENWGGPYALFSVLLLLAAAVATFAITMYTSRPGPPSASRIAAIALAVLATVSTVAAWAFPLWAVLLATGVAALAATGPRHRRNALWLGAALLGGLAVAVVGVTAELGPAGSYNDYSEAQGWGITVACALAAVVLAMLARRSSATADTVPAKLPR